MCLSSFFFTVDKNHSVEFQKSILCSVSDLYIWKGYERNINVTLELCLDNENKNYNLKNICTKQNFYVHFRVFYNESMIKYFLVRF